MCVLCVCVFCVCVLCVCVCVCFVCVLCVVVFAPCQQLTAHAQEMRLHPHTNTHIHTHAHTHAHTQCMCMCRFLLQVLASIENGGIGALAYERVEHLVDELSEIRDTLFEMEIDFVSEVSGCLHASGEDLSLSHSHTHTHSHTLSLWCVFFFLRG